MGAMSAWTKMKKGAISFWAILLTQLLFSFLISEYNCGKLLKIIKKNKRRSYKD